MKELQEQLLIESANLDKNITKAEKYLASAPEGTLRIAKKGKGNQYYWRTDCKDTIGKYIKKEKREFIKQLAQKDYLQKWLKTAKKNQASLKGFLKNYQFEDRDIVYENLPETRKKLVTPYVKPIEEFVMEWEQQKYPAFYQPSDNAIYTEKGEAVRSKSEKILADKLYFKNIPYHYEKPLYLKGYGVIHPDFTVLNQRTGKEYYWEHLGMMGNEHYCEKAIKKIDTYHRNGIFTGDQLILTYETQAYPLNTRSVDEVIKKYL